MVGTLDNFVAGMEEDVVKPFIANSIVINLPEDKRAAAASNALAVARKYSTLEFEVLMTLAAASKVGQFDDILGKLNDYYQTNLNGSSLDAPNRVELLYEKGANRYLAGLAGELGVDLALLEH